MPMEENFYIWPLETDTSWSWLYNVNPILAGGFFNSGEFTKNRSLSRLNVYKEAVLTTKLVMHVSLTCLYIYISFLHEYVYVYTYLYFFIYSIYTCAICVVSSCNSIAFWDWMGVSVHPCPNQH